MELHTTYGFLLRQFCDLLWGKIWRNVFVDAFSFLMILTFAAFAILNELFQNFISGGILPVSLRHYCTELL
jgi:hypothetical protein